MKNEKFNSLKKQAEVYSTFAARTIGNAKRQLRLETIISNVENLTEKQVIDETLAYFKKYLNTIDKNVRGFIKKEFCDVVRIIVSQNELLNFVDASGRINPNSVLAKMNRKNAGELLTILSNCLLQDAAKDANNTLLELSAVETMTELLSYYKAA